MGKKSQNKNKQGPRAAGGTSASSPATGWWEDRRLPSAAPTSGKRWGSDWQDSKEEDDSDNEEDYKLPSRARPSGWVGGDWQGAKEAQEDAWTAPIAACARVDDWGEEEVKQKADKVDPWDEGKQSSSSRFPKGFRPRKLCKFHESGRCPKGDKCKFAHDESELHSEAVGAARANGDGVPVKSEAADSWEVPVLPADGNAWERKTKKEQQARESLETENPALQKKLLQLEQEASGLRRSLQEEKTAHSKTRQALQQAKADLAAEVKRKQNHTDTSGLQRSLLEESTAHSKTRQALQEAMQNMAELAVEGRRKQSDVETLRQTLAREKKGFADQLRTKEEALVQATRLSTTLQAQVRSQDEKLREVAEVATMSFAQWYWNDDHGTQIPYGAAANLQVEKAHQAFCSHSFCSQIELKINEFSYIIDFHNMLQTNKKTLKQRRLTRKVVDGRETADVVEKVRQALAAKSLEAAAQQRRTIEELTSPVCHRQPEGGGFFDHLFGRIGAHKDTAGLERELRVARADEQDLRRRLAEAEQKLQKSLADTVAQKAKHDAALAKGIELEAGERRRAIEFWRAHAPGACLVTEPLTLRVQSILQDCSHKQQVFRAQVSQCVPFQQVKVHSVRAVHNPTSYQAYQRHLETMSRNHKHNKTQARSLPLVASSVALSSLFPGIVLNAELNEVLLMHGCKDASTNSIVTEGFDIRHTRNGSLYGEGVYFASEACKCHQYTDVSGAGQVRHIFISRVALGDAAFLTARHQGRHPPMRPCGLARYDSAVVDPAKSTCDQHHWEYVVYKGEQACPELLVTYSV